MEIHKPKSTTPWKFYVLYASMPRGWNPLEQFTIDGQGWRATFRKSGPPLPYTRMKGDTSIETNIDEYPGPCVEILVDTNESDCDKAIDIGSPIADVIAGLLIHRVSINIINDKIWSGLLGTKEDGSMQLAMAKKLLLWNGAPLNELKDRASETSAFNPVKGLRRAIIPTAFRWFLKGLLEIDRNDRFISIWLSATALYSSWCELNKKSYSIWCSKQQDTRDTERNMMRYYIQDVLKLSGNEEDIFFKILSDSYTLRNKLLHESEIDIIKNDNINWLVRTVGSMLWIEMGYPLGGSPAILIRNYPH